MASSLYPVALDLRGRRCVVVGAGPVGRRRAASLAEAGAQVVVVAPETGGPFAPHHLDDAFLVVAATNDPTVNAAVAEAARERGVLVNLAAPGAEGEAGDFVTMAAVRRGELLLAVTTGGAGPALAARLRDSLAERYPEPWADYAATLATLRAEAKESEPDPEARATYLRRLAHHPALEAKALAGDTDGALSEGRACR